MARTDMDHLLEQIDQLATNPPEDAQQRRRLYNAAQKLATAVEAPHDTVYRLIYSPILLTMAEVAGNMQIFQTLVAASKHGDSCTVSQLAAPTGADDLLTARIARNLASHQLITEMAPDLYTANPLSHTLSHEGFRAGIKFYFHSTMPCLQVLPTFLQNSTYTNPTSMCPTPFSLAFHTSLPRFVWMNQQPPSDPSSAANFGLWMSAQHDPRLTWLRVLDFPSEIAKGAEKETVVFVDVGGGIGAQCAGLKKEVPDLVGRVILQDCPVVLERALETEGVERMGFDFWDLQVVRGARSYYMRYIMHDYPDEQCQLILKNTMAAMDPHDSVILIDDVIIPETGAHSHSTDKDISMMVNLGAMERTKRQWLKLFSSVGLRQVKVATYNELSGESIQVLKIDKRG